MVQKVRRQTNSKRKTSAGSTEGLKVAIVCDWLNNGQIFGLDGCKCFRHGCGGCSGRFDNGIFQG